MAKKVAKKIAKEVLEEAPETVASTVEKILSQEYTMPKAPTTAKPITDTDSEEYFVGGIVRSGFRKTYGEEITNLTDSEQVSDLISAAHEVFKKEDGFRFFLNYLDGMKFTILVPLKFTNADLVYLDVYSCDARSIVLRPGNTREQVISACRKWARHLGYAKNR